MKTVALISLEPWDEVRRRNQHLAHQLVAQGLCERIVFVEPPGRGAPARTPEPGITVLAPRLLGPRRWGGLALSAAALRRRLGPIDLLWVNDAPFGRHLLRPGLPAVYDVTDDWRASTQHPRVRRRLIAAEDRLARDARTIVCSPTLRDRWAQRYAVDATLVTNGADVDAIAAAERRALPGPGPHAVYVGTLHRDRLDLDLIVETARAVGTLHLVGPDALDEAAGAQLRAVPNLILYGPVPAHDVPGWLASADILICPHVVSAFTLSLDAIKAYEYLASDRPVVATPTCGFAGIVGLEGVTVTPRPDFAAAVRAAPGGCRPRVAVASWGDQALRFAATLDSVIGSPAWR